MSITKATSIDKTLDGRDETHGDFVDQAEAAMRMLEVLNRTEGWIRCPKWMQYAISMILMKLARIVHGDCRATDHWHDIQGYARLVEREFDGSQERK